MDMDFHFTVQKPSMHRARMIGLRMVEEYLEGKLDEIHVIYTNMENAVTNETQTLQLLPLKKASFHTELKREFRRMYIMRRSCWYRPQMKC